jgi:hypothetical protein
MEEDFGGQTTAVYEETKGGEVVHSTRGSSPGTLQTFEGSTMPNDPVFTVCSI